MATITYKFLHFANLKDIPNWSVQYADEEDLGFTKKYPMATVLDDVHINAKGYESLMRRQVQTGGLK